MMNSGRAVSAVAARWVARILSAALLLFWGFFLTAHVLGDAGDPSRSLTRGDYVIVGGLLVSLVGLAVAWRWEAAGAITALLGVAVGAATNWKVLIFPGVLIPITALLFITSWWLGRTRDDGDALR